jgi:hypothetical protein
MGVLVAGNGVIVAGMGDNVAGKVSADTGRGVSAWLISDSAA